MSSSTIDQRPRALAALGGGRRLEQLAMRRRAVGTAEHDRPVRKPLGAKDRREQQVDAVTDVQIRYGRQSTSGENPVGC
jgi:hypothetical protein